MTCISCRTEHNEKFCPNCGEKSGVKPITFATMTEAAFNSFTNMDKGFLFNVKQLIRNPRKLITEYINGKRKGVLNPISFLIICVSVYLVIDSLIKVPVDKNETESQAYSVGYAAGEFLKDYFKYFWILSIFWLGISTKLIFRKYNYAEHLTISSFIIGLSTLVGISIFIFTKIPLLFNPIVYISILWMLYRVFKKDSYKLSSLFESLAAVVLFFLQLFLIIIGIGFIRTL